MNHLIVRLTGPMTLPAPLPGCVCCLMLHPSLISYDLGKNHSKMFVCFNNQQSQSTKSQSLTIRSIKLPLMASQVAWDQFSDGNSQATRQGSRTRAVVLLTALGTLCGGGAVFEISTCP